MGRSQSSGDWDTYTAPIIPALHAFASCAVVPSSQINGRIRVTQLVIYSIRHTVKKPGMP
jgi:hypothetical protein